MDANTTNVNQMGGAENSGARAETQPFEKRLSETISTCFDVLAAVQRNSIYYVLSAENDEEKLKRANEIIERYGQFSSGRIAKCKPPRVYNEVTDRCEFPSFQG